MIKLKNLIKQQHGMKLCKVVERLLETSRKDYQAQKEKVLRRLARLPLKTKH